MLLYVSGNLFQSPADVLVNTVNTVGVMGKGVALEFKRLYPEMFRQYRELCEQGSLSIGTLWLYQSRKKSVLCFPTKAHWRNPSRLEYVEAGLRKFVDIYPTLGISSIAFPPLGCGNGQLDFDSEVRPLMERYLRPLPIDVFIYPDRKAPYIPEHLDAKAIKEWLRSEPANLPFTEVWSDLIELVSQRHEWSTLHQDRPFTVGLSYDDRTLTFTTASGKQYVVEYDELHAFWTQLQSYGFTFQQIAPHVSLGKRTYYVAAVFAGLPYVEPVRVSTKYERVIGPSAAVGLQVLPSGAGGARFQQPSLPMWEVHSAEV